MPGSLAFILGLLDQSFPAFVAQEDFAGEHGQALRLWQRRGFLSTEPERHPTPSCPHCREGVPYRLGDRCLCDFCYSTIDPRHLQRWRFDLGAFLSWLAQGLKLNSEVRQVDDQLWQLGSIRADGILTECFFGRGGKLAPLALGRLLAYRNALLFRPLPQAEAISGFHGRTLALVEVLSQDDRSLQVADVGSVLRQHGSVRFEEASGALFVGDAYLGDVPPGSKEYHLLACLARAQDVFVAYSDLKRYVLERTVSRDTTDEATFCQKLKSRMKRGIPTIDRLIATTNKGDGYRLRAFTHL